MTDNYKLDYKIDFILTLLTHPSAFFHRLTTAIRSLPTGDVVDVYALKLGIPVSSTKEANGIKKKYKECKSLPWE